LNSTTDIATPGTLEYIVCLRILAGIWYVRNIYRYFGTLWVALVLMHAWYTLLCGTQRGALQSRARIHQGAGITHICTLCAGNTHRPSTQNRRGTLRTCRHTALRVQTTPRGGLKFSHYASFTLHTLSMQSVPGSNIPTFGGRTQ
jgi:hypothetical protein